MINPLRRSLYEWFVLPALRLVQTTIDISAVGLHTVRHALHTKRASKSRSVTWTVRSLAFVFAVLVPLAQGQGTPPYFPSDAAKSGPQDRKDKPDMPPDTKAPPHEKLSTAEVQQQVQNKLDGEPMLKGLSLTATADDTSVTVSGTVDNAEQRNLAMRIAKSYAGERELVDKITIAE
jgi:hypothetical protein